MNSYENKTFPKECSLKKKKKNKVRPNYNWKVHLVDRMKATERRFHSVLTGRKPCSCNDSSEIKRNVPWKV